MYACPRCGAELIISYPYGPTAWVGSCAQCVYGGGGTVYEGGGTIENDDYPIFTVLVVDPGPQRARLFQLYREVLRVSPKHAIALIVAPCVEVARGPRMVVERYIDQFQAAGATLEIVRA